MKKDLLFTLIFLLIFQLFSLLVTEPKTPFLALAQIVGYMIIDMGVWYFWTLENRIYRERN